MKVQFEEHIQSLEISTSQLLKSIDINRTKVTETTPDFERLTDQHEQISRNYESAKETMIETKRKKQEVLDKISSTEKDIREKNKSRDITVLAIKESQREVQEYMQNTHTETLKLEEEIYEKGCRLETLEEENERFQKVIERFRIR